MDPSDSDDSYVEPQLDEITAYSGTVKIELCERGSVARRNAPCQNRGCQRGCIINCASHDPCTCGVGTH